MTIEFFRVYLVINSKAFAAVNMSKLILISVNCMHSPTNYSSFDPFEMKGLENFVSFDDKGPLFNFKFCLDLCNIIKANYFKKQRSSSSFLFI